MTGENSRPCAKHFVFGHVTSMNVEMICGKNYVFLHPSS